MHACSFDALSDQFPRQASPDRPNVLQQGQVRRYPAMQPGIDNTPRRLQVRTLAFQLLLYPSHLPLASIQAGRPRLISHLLWAQE
eukprot:scaffold21887_cov21-Tisochrysis_lutea.AAC.2